MRYLAIGFMALSICATAALGQATGPLAAGSMMAPPPQAKIETSLGSFTISLDRINAPKAVDNFMAYARARHYDGTIVYRIEPGFVIQMGSFEPGDASRPVGAPIPLETANGLHNTRGTVALARQSDPNSATAEFFVNLADNPDLDAKPGAPPNTTGYTVFGRVSDGMDVVDKIAAVPLGGQGPFPPRATPTTPVLIRKVTITESPSPNPPPFAR
ncbi:MAG TPA: peptidylprolyl isomerase [Rhizomicrobium sp.]|nr:peptidylprolyl isomerase [Rhizomicrobium sp.]